MNNLNNAINRSIVNDFDECGSVENSCKLKPMLRADKSGGQSPHKHTQSIVAHGLHSSKLLNSPSSGEFLCVINLSKRITGIQWVGLPSRSSVGVTAQLRCTHSRTKSYMGTTIAHQCPKL